MTLAKTDRKAKAAARKKAYMQAYRETNREKIAATHKKYDKEHYKANREKILKRNGRTRARTNKSQNIKSGCSKTEYDKEYRKINAEIIARRSRLYESRRYAEAGNYKIARLLRARLKIAIKSGYKSGSAVRDLGCTIDELKMRFESMFQHGMSWENHGEWHIDHIRPLSSFDLEDREQLLAACHYKNLQPLWASANLIKGVKRVTLL